MCNDAYINLIEDARAYYNSAAPEIRNIKGKEGLFDLVWCDDLKEEINLWTCWQGRGQNKAKVMIVGQDFGNYKDSEYYEDYKRIAHSSFADKVNGSKEYIEFVIRSKSPTDKTLIQLTKKCLGNKYSADIPANENLFFTNLCLGYRTGRIFSGGDVYSLLKHDSIFLKRLIEIKKPEIVICLGADTYLAALTGIVDETTRDGLSDYYERIGSDFWNLLDHKDNMKELKIAGHSFKIFGVSHTGSNGRINRKRLSEAHKDDDISAVELMEQDWKEIAKYL